MILDCYMFGYFIKDGKKGLKNCSLFMCELKYIIRTIIRGKFDPSRNKLEKTS